MTAEGPDLSKTGGGPLALSAFNHHLIVLFEAAPANWFTFNSSSLARLRLIARAPNIIGFLENYLEIFNHNR